MSSVSLLRAPVVSSSAVMAWSVHDVVECQPASRPAGRASVIVRGEARVGRVFRDGNRGLVVVKHSSCVARLLVDWTIRGALPF